MSEENVKGDSIPKQNKESIFKKLSAVDVSKYIENKGKMKYLSWANAWSEVKKRFPLATYSIKKFGAEQKPYLYDPNTGYMVFTEVAIDNLSYEMWLPVMDFSNKAMMKATMFDINKAIMRCLVKNIAMFGLGLYIYSGEDLPEDKTTIIEKCLDRFGSKREQALQNILTKFNVQTLDELTESQAREVIRKVGY